MKKPIIFASILLALILLGAISVVASAGKFVSSPSSNPAPTLVEGKNLSEDCKSEVQVTAYKNRDLLTSKDRQAIETAYTDIVGTVDISSLNSKVKDMAAELGINVADLAVSDLFDISATQCQEHEGHGKYKITLKAETLDKFVCLLNYHNDEWRIIEGAKADGDHLTFETDTFSPFAIVVNTGSGETDEEEEENTPSIFDNLNVGAVVTASVVAIAPSAAGVVVYLFKKGKKTTL